jgi:2-polyprenyl-6-methoxyphenol hydroxylase-like FAD-dependent oxidoreductase
VVWRQRVPVHLTNWSVLWQSLRRRTAGCSYHSGTAATVVAADETSVTVSANGAQERFDLAIGADGNGSAVHRLVSPESQAYLPGYGLWRGTYPEDLLPDGAIGELEHAVAMVCFPGGHAIIYLIPDHRHASRRLVNWAIYLTPPTAFTDGSHLPPGRVPEPLLQAMHAVVTAHFPPLWADLVARTEPGDIAVQPMIDVPAARYAAGRVALAGDAGTTARPHTASGTVKALQDAIALEAAARGGHQDWSSALAAYGSERCGVGNALVRLGGSLGHAAVEATPDWGAMSAAEYAAWWNAAAVNPATAYEW